jgi:DNA polymerase III delta prime subunit
MITSIRIENFKDKSIYLTIPEKGIMVSGQNGVGKTSIIDAICWCLYGKFSDGSTGDPRPRDNRNQLFTNKEVVVELVIKNNKFIRSVMPIWDRKTDTFTGWEYQYWVDDSLLPAKEYSLAVTELIGDADTFLMATIPTYFNSDRLHWTARRRALLSLIDKPTNKDMIKSCSELSEILTDNRTEADYLNMLKEAQYHSKKAGKKLDELLVRLNELSNLHSEMGLAQMDGDGKYEPAVKMIWARMGAINDMRKELVKSYDTYQRIIELINLRQKVWTQLIEERLNAMFGICKFKLFHLQENGEVKETCEVLFNGQDQVSTGENLLAGIEIANRFNKNELPLLIDNLQDLTYPVKFNRQVIGCRTTSDKEMKIEEQK